LGDDPERTINVRLDMRVSAKAHVDTNNGVYLFHGQAHSLHFGGAVPQIRHKYPSRGSM
jgi:hypothetical protein